MSDIYHVLITHDFQTMDIETLKEVRLHSEVAFNGVMSGMAAMGSLAFWASTSEEYDSELAAQDLRNLGEMMAQLPRMAVALNENVNNADFEIWRREGFPT